MNNKQPKKPFALLYDEAEGVIFNAVSTAARIIPFYLIEGILTNILHQVRKQAKAEKDNAKQLYKKQLADYEKAVNETEAESEGES